MQWIKQLSGKAIGYRFERLARKYLEQQGLSIVEQNYHCTMGEIDLIMQQDNVLVFVEVKYRNSAEYGHSSEMINSNKLTKMIKTAQHYMLSKNINEFMASYHGGIIPKLIKPNLLIRIYSKNVLA